VNALCDPEAANERLIDVTLALARTALDQGGLGDADPAEALRSGAAAERFAVMVAALGGPADFLERRDAYLDRAPVVVMVPAEREGYVTSHATREIGLLVTELGGNRHVETDVIDHGVGLDELAGPGDHVGPGRRPLGFVHARDEASADAAIRALRAAITIEDEPPPIPPIVTEELR
jgi:thymidine phosphorylase